jgi:RNA polymerase sigma factor (sigma-70 family)
MGGVGAALAEHAFEHLFMECLGWDRISRTIIVTHGDVTLNLTAVAQKRGLMVFVCHTHRTVLANRHLLRCIQRQLRRSHHEHILIYYCETPRKQVWQWATTLADGRRILHREHPFFSNDPPKRLVERIERLSFSFEEEEQTTLPDVLNRVRDALSPDSELNLFAKYPSFAAESDRLAMAMKRGAPGALQAFVEFHIPLARHSSRMLIRWFAMDPDDAEQTAMIGLLEAARRFDPDRGYQFSTYAGFWIRNACQRYGLKWGLAIHVPVHYFWTCYKLSFEEARLIATYGDRDAREQFEQCMKEAGVTPKQWRHFCVAREVRRFSELDKSVLRSLDRPDESLPAVEDVAMARQDIGQALLMLHPRQARILRMRYGIGQPEHTLEEVGRKYKLTRERVRQIQEKSEKKLRQMLRGAEYTSTSSHKPLNKKALNTRIAGATK